MSESLFGVHRPITITARLYLGGAYLRLTSEQAIIAGDILVVRQAAIEHSN
jgi:hypothetical protein